MIEKLDKKMEFVEISVFGNKKAECLDFEAGRKLNLKINELVDAVNDIQKEREAEWFEIKAWIGILEAVRKSVNVHEKQIDELQMKVEPEKLEIDDTDDIAEVKNENVQPDYVTTTYITDGHTKEYYGQNGASIVADHPLPAGYVITIRETETKGE